MRNLLNRNGLGNKRDKQMTYDAFIMSGVAEHYTSELHRLQLSLA